MSRFVNPVPQRISQGFGANPDFYAQYAQKGHTGIDFASFDGTPVQASGAGTVGFAGPGADDMRMTSVAGNSIVIDHGDICTAYAHLSKIVVRSGQLVEQGTVIGYTGRTGVVAGPHLHFEFITVPWQRYNGWYGRTDPDNHLNKGEDMSTDKMTRDEVIEIHQLAFQGERPADDVANAWEGKPLAPYIQWLHSGGTWIDRTAELHKSVANTDFWISEVKKRDAGIDDLRSEISRLGARAAGESPAVENLKPGLYEVK